MKNPHGIKRRTFLKGAAATASASLFPLIMPQSAWGANDRIVMGAIGTGGQGMDNMRNLLRHRHVQMVAVCDVDRKHAESAKTMCDRRHKNDDCAIHTDFREITRRKDIDAVLIATPDHWHCIPAIDASNHKKDIYVQKPMAYTIHEGRVLADTVKKNKTILQTGSQQRSGKTFYEAVSRARNGLIGDITAIHVGIPGNNRECGPTWSPQPVPEGFDYDMWLGPAPWAEYHELRCHYTFRFILDYSGGQVTNFGAHNLDIAQWALDMDDSGPVEITGNGQFPESGLFTTATKVFFECKYANDAVVTCRTGKFGMYIEGTEGTIYVDRQGIKASDDSILKRPLGKNPVDIYKSTNHFTNFLDCVKSRQQPICDAEVGHRSSTVCNLGNIAMQLGRKLEWDPKKEVFKNDDEANSMIKREARGEWAKFI